MAQNDWIVAGINNPDFTPYDFSTIADMDLNNTQMLSADEYLKSDFIKNHEMFKDESGNFSDKKFRQYHQKRVQDFLEFQEQEFPKGLELDMFDTDRTKESRVKDIRFDLGRHVNPDRQAVGIEGVRVWSDPTQTKSEIAQSQKIWDTNKQEFKDFSSNDKALSNGLFDWLEQVFSDPLVMAQYEEDGEHIDPITGLVRKHKKGDYKLNDKGTYYYETLDGRSPIGKEVLSVFDTLSVDGEGINKYDFFDSDDVKKSVGGVIAKNVAIMLPMFAGGMGAAGVATAYSALLAAKEFSKAMPMLYGFATMLSDKQEQPKWVNNVAAWGTKLSGGTSQYAKENTFSFENFGNLISDVALQWGQQKVIAQAFNKLKGSNTYIDDAMKNAENLYKVKSKELGESAELWQVCQNKFLPEAQKLATQASQLGRDASLAYMAIVSNSDLYNEMRNMGLTNTEAAAVALGSTLGMFGLNKYTGLGEIFFDDATDDAVKLARQAVKDEMKDAVSMFKSIKQSNLPQPNKYLNYIKVASDKVSGVFSKFSDDLKYHTLNFAGKAAGEGLEEVSEELISDVAKEIYELAGQFGVDTTLKDVGAWDNALERYTMSFLGGAIGGGIFYGKEALIDGKSYKRDSKNWEIANLIRNGHGNELRAEIEKMKKAGKLGNTKLSASKYEETDKGEKVWLTTENQEESQNDAIGNAMLEKVNALEAVINNNRIGLSDEQLFENMVLTEKRYKRYEKIAPLTNYYQDFSNIVNELIAAELDFKKASATVEGTVNGTPRTDAKLTPEQEVARQQQLAPLQARVEEARKKKDEFLSGDTSLEYTRKLNFIMDPTLHSQFLSIDKNQYFKEQYGDRSYAELTPEEMIKFELDWQAKVESTLKEEINQSWDKYKEIEALIIPELQELSINTPEYKKFSKESESLFQGALDIDKLFQSYISWDSQLEGEDDETFASRNNKKIITGTTISDTGEEIAFEEEESDAEFALRRLNRTKAIQQYNDQKDQEWVDKVNEHLSKVGYKVDPFTFRYLKRALPQRQQDIVTKKLELSILPSNIRQIFKKLDKKLSNVDEIKQLLYTSILEQSKSEVKSILNKLNSLEILDEDGDVVDLNDYVINSEDGELTLLEISQNPDILDIKDADLIDSLIALTPILGEDTTFADVVQNGLYLLESNSKIEEYTKQSVQVHENQLESLLQEIKTNPIYSFVDSIQTQVKNPVGELIKSLSAKNGDEIPNVDELLDFIQEDFESIEDVNQLILDDTQMSNLQKVKDYMKLIEGFMYAASSNPDKNNPIGHNQVINAFAQTHKDSLLKEWNPLPEIDSDYFTLYDQSIAQYSSEIDYWINLSNANNVNKIRKFVATDRAFNIALYDSIKQRDLKFKIDDKEFNLLEGIVEGDFEPEVKLFNTEQLLHRNFQKALKESGLTVSEFLQKSGLLEKLIPSIDNIAKQKVANLTDTLKSNDLTDFDLVQYFAQVFTLNPSKFYEELKGKVKVNEKVAPITAQEYSTKLAKAITSQQYRDIMKYAYQKSNSQLPFLNNTLIIPGVAGAGKTAVVLSSVNDPNDDVIVAGPTKTQADKLQKSLNRNQSYTFQQLLETILGTEQLNAIRAEFSKVKNGDKIETYDSEYFTVEGINGVAVVKLKRDSLKFNKLEKTPKKLFLDEATHLSALEIQILDAFAESIGAVNYLAGDPNQRGAFDKKAKTENLQEDQVFSSRAPKLSISLRDNNLQKYLNQENVRALLDQVNDAILDLSKEDLDQFWPRALNTISKFNFKVYNHDELNGDLITSDLSSELIEKIKNGTVGFIGNNNSPYLEKLRNAGITPTVLSMDEMQGEEFDFVVIDQEWTAPQANFSIKQFLTDLYTTMTRARTASIFIDNGLSSIIGKNVNSDNKSQAPSILAGVDELRAKKLNILEQFKLDLEEVAVSSESKEEENVLPKNPDEDFMDPDSKNIDQEVKDIIVSSTNEDEQQVQENMVGDFAKDGEQVVETFSDITILGVVKSEKPEKRIIKHNGKDKKVEVPIWTIRRPAEGPLRNLQALFKDGTELIKYSDKQDAQKQLFDIKSSIIYQHGYDKLPREIRKYFSKNDWESGKLELEIREVSDSDTTHLNAKYKEPGIEYKGKRYIVNVVFAAKTKSGDIAKFDISGLPSLDNYHQNITKIKENLAGRISKAKGEEKTKLQKRLDGVDATFVNYENLLKTWIEQFENGTFEPISLDDSVLSFNKTTWFQDLQKSEREAGIQLGGKLDPITGERSRDNLILRHPELVFSEIYTFAGEKGVFEQLDPSIKGKAVVFVSSDTLLSSDELLSVYIDQKNNPRANTARVRMLVLDNYGMNFSQFTDPKFIKDFQHGDEERKPFRQNYTGIRMFTSLWNWRASLIKFNKAVEDWQSEHGYTEQQINALLEAQQKEYDSEQFEDVLKNNKLTTADLENLKKFNSENCSEIPIFRLGYSKNGNGFYVRQENVKNSTVYDKDTVNLLAITPQKAKQFEVLINRLLSAIEYNEQFGQQSLGLRLLKEDKTAWGQDELIDLTDSKHKRTLSGLLSDQNGKLLLQADGVNIAYTDGNQWSMIPAVLSNLVRTITYFQHNENELNDKGVQCARITYQNGDTKVLMQTQVNDLFENGDLKFGDDHSLFDLVNLVFHGTSDDIHKKLSTGESLMQIEDAYFKYGFFISPDVSRTSAKNGDPEIFRREDSQGNVLFYKIATSPELFTVDTDVRTSGVGIRIDELYKKAQEEIIKEEEKSVESESGKSSEQLFKEEYPELSKIIETGIMLGQDFEFDLDSADKAISWYNNTLETHIKNKINLREKDVLDSPFKITLLGTALQTTTLKDYIASITGSNSIEIDFAKDVIIKSNGQEYTMNDSFEIKRIGAVLEEKQSKYRQKLSDGRELRKAVLDILSDKDTQTEIINDFGVSEQDLINLYTNLDNLFNSDRSDEEIQKELENLSNSDETYSSAFMPYIQINNSEIDEILNGC